MVDVIETFITKCLEKDKWLYNVSTGSVFHPNEVQKMIMDNPVQKSFLSKLEWIIVDPLEKYKSMMNERQILDSKIDEFRKKLETALGTSL